MRAMITGGCGYIGSNVAKHLMRSGWIVLIVDNMANARPDRLLRISKACDGVHALFEQADVRDQEAMGRIVESFRPDWTIHCAGLKSVRESKSKPLDYWSSNVEGTRSLIHALGPGSKIVFSSSATVYAPSLQAVGEDAATAPATPYGRSKLACEWMLEDAVGSGQLSEAIALRYFNPLGSDDSGWLGDLPLGSAENVMPRLMQSTPDHPFEIMGSDYPTRDGSAMRDYIHIEDLALAHLAAVKARQEPARAWRVYNVGTSRGATVKELVEAYEWAKGAPMHWRWAPRREGDAAFSMADCSAIQKDLGWRAQRDLRSMCSSAMNVKN